MHRFRVYLMDNGGIDIIGTPHQNMDVLHTFSVTTARGERLGGICSVLDLRL